MQKNQEKQKTNLDGAFLEKHEVLPDRVIRDQDGVVCTVGRSRAVCTHMCSFGTSYELGQTLDAMMGLKDIIGPVPLLVSSADLIVRNLL